MKAELPEVEMLLGVPASWFHPGGVAGFGDKKLKARPNMSTVVFSISLIVLFAGDRNQLFADKQGVRAFEPFAKTLFGTAENLIGKTIHYDEYEFTGDFVIRGIFRPNPANAVEHFDLLFNYALCLERRTGLNEWGNDDPHTFVLLKPGTNIARFNKEMCRFFIRKKAWQGL